MKPGMAIIDGFLHQPLAIFYQTSPHFGGKLTIFVAVPAQNTWVSGCRPELYYLFQSQYEFMMKVHEAWEGKHG